ncbi:OprO/OprP family phosphate-selective porin [Planctomicrobium piriforme]|uniref:Phosphate-selective porin OprO and OprP n=1 Tax=Planctomicrobium piriforme TaxID=1576369 RepID=A0A1I3B7K6_9PLAN|nr:porin [Planctomicrobium piriforme]SFH57691.1 phosphate-selective porin OprO and OprP [Planctomicrobium piriforme]
MKRYSRLLRNRRLAWLGIILCLSTACLADDAEFAADVFDDGEAPAFVQLSAYEEPVQLPPAPSPAIALADTIPPDPPDELSKLMAEVNKLKDRLKTMEDDGKKKAADAKKNEFPSFKITGFTQLDSAAYSQSPNNIATVGNAQDGTGFRRARLAVQGKVAEFTSYQVEMDFATAGRPSFFDTYVEQSNIPYLGTVRVGQFCQPFSVDSLTGFRNLTFLERSLPFLAFVPFRRVGAQAANIADDEMSQWAYSVFRTGGYKNAPLGDNRYGVDIGDVGGVSFSTRATHLIQYDPHANDRYLWHIGASYDYSVLGADTAAGSTTQTPFYQTRVLPEFGPLGYSEDAQAFGFANNSTPVFVDSGRYPANHFNLFGLETVYQNGPWGVQAEYMATVVDSIVGNIFYNGAYTQVAYRLTGEHRAYDKKNGTLGRLVPFTDFFSFKKKGIQGMGAWEVAGRLSFVDIRNPDSLNGQYLNGTSNAGNGTLVDSTLGFTWFLNTHTKFQGNWIHCMLNNSDRGHSTANLFVSRVQVDF